MNYKAIGKDCIPAGKETCMEQKPREIFRNFNGLFEGDTTRRCAVACENELGALINLAGP